MLRNDSYRRGSGGGRFRVLLATISAILMLATTIVLVPPSEVDAFPVGVAWGSTEHRYRLPVDVTSAPGGNDLVAVVDVNFTSALVEAGASGATFDPATLLVHEVDAAGALLDGQVAFQFDPGISFDPTFDASGELVLALSGSTLPAVERHFAVYFEQAGVTTTPPTITPVVALVETIDEGLLVAQVTTPSTVWSYDLAGGGFSSVVDAVGNDWVGYSTATGSAGEFRGIPNLVFPEGHFHPGATTSTSTVGATGPIRATVTSATVDGWQIRWEIFATNARATVLSAPSDYWFLYEGTPGGALDAGDQVISSDGTVTSALGTIDGDIIGAEWMAFADPAAGRSLFVANHVDDTAFDSYRDMNDEMTVFGFGRDGLSSELTGTGRSFSVGLIDQVDHALIAPVVGASLTPPTAAVGIAENDGTANSYAVDVSVVGLGSVVKSPDAPVYVDGTTVQLTATPDAGQVFVGWSGDVTSTDAVVDVTVSGAAVAVTATFEAAPVSYAVDVSVVGLGSVVKSPDAPVYVDGTTVQLTATPDAGQVFVGWSGDVTSTDAVVDVTVSGAAVAVTATFEAAPVSYAVDVSVVGLGSVVKSPDAPVYVDGTTVQLTATPDAGQVFVGWSGDVTSTDAVVDVTVSGAAVAVTATFEAAPVSYAVDVSVVGLGSVVKSPDAPVYVDGTTVQLTATPDAGQVFVGWSGDVTSTDAVVDVTVSGAAVAVTATFEAAPPSNFVSDDFDDAALAAQWTFIDPVGDSSFTLTGAGSGQATVSLAVPADSRHDLFNGANDAARLMQPLSDVDVELEASFLSTQTERFQLQGMLVEQDQTNWLRFDLFHDGTNLRVFAASTTAGSSSSEFNSAVPAGTSFLRLQRVGDLWTGWYSSDGVAWTEAGSFTFALTVTAAGVFAGNAGDDPAFTSVIDYVFDTATPVVPEDGVLSYPIDVTVVGAGSVTKSPDQSNYLDGTTVQLTATPDAGETFIGWSGDVTSTDAVIDVVVTAAVNVTATFSNGTPPQPFVSDDFDTAALASQWTFIDPVGDASFSLAGVGTGNASVSLVLPAGSRHDQFGSTNDAARLMQPVVDDDMELEVSFQSTLSERFQLQGLLVEQDDANWLRYDLFHDGSNLRVFAASTTNNSSDAEFNVVVPPGTSFLRLSRSGDLWTGSYSSDGQNWTTAGSFTFAMNMSQAGVFAGNAGDDPAFTAVIDYVFETATPVVPEDGVFTYPLTVTVVGDGSVTKTPDQTTYLDGSVVQLTATPQAGETFVGWSGDVTSTDATIDVTMASAINVTATFTTDTPAPPFVSDDFDNTVLGNQWTFVDPLGDSSFALAGADTGQATLTLSVPAGTGHNLWADDKDAPRMMQAIEDADFEIEVGFLSDPTLRYQVQGLLVEQDDLNWLRFDAFHDGSDLRIFGGVTANGSSQAEFDIEVTEAVRFLRLNRAGDDWTASYSVDGTTWSTAGTFTYALNVTSAGVFVGNVGDDPAFDAVVDYVFNTASPIDPEDGVFTYPVNVTTVGFGSVVKSPDQDEYLPGTVVELTAVADAGETFLGWAGVPGTDPVLLVTIVDGPVDVTANFTEIGPGNPVIVDIVGDGQVSRSPNQPTYADGTTVQLTASPNNGESFLGWTGDVTSTNPVIDVVVDGAPVSLTATFSDTPPASGIDVWYGSTQTFGQNGITQRWVSVLGKIVDPANAASLDFRLNGGPLNSLEIGTDLRRIYGDGDFNVEIDRADLLIGSNVVEIVLTDTGGNETSEVVTVIWAPTPIGPNYTVDWSSALSVNDGAQVVDGLWELRDGKLRTTETGYDRAVAIGDLGWENYTVEVPVTIHSLAPGSGTPQSGLPLVGFGVRWLGHSEVAGAQPNYGFYPTGAFTYYRIQSSGLPRLAAWGNDGSPSDRTRIELDFGVEYIFKASAQTVVGGTEYKFKAWVQGEPEPAGWAGEILEDDGPGSGSLLLLAHHFDVSFGNVVVTSASGPIGNQAPLAGAGADSAVLLPNVAQLNGFVSDDGMPAAPGVVTSTWSAESGPGVVTFADSTAPVTTASFSAEGSYVLRLSATDGDLTSFDEVTITVSSVSSEGTFADDFNPAGYSGNDGTLDFAGPWVEVNDDGVSTTGDVWLWTTDAACTPAPCVRIHAVSGNEGIERSLDLSAMSQATLSFDYYVWGGTNGANLILDDGTNTVSVQQLQVASSGSTGAATIDIGSYIDLTSTVTIRFQATSATGNRTYPDNIVVTTVVTPNAAPSVDAGGDLDVTLPNQAQLVGSVTDDGLPSIPGTATTNWSVVSGPGGVTFGAASSPTSSASFSAPGVYLLRLTANDGALTASDDVQVTVTELSSGGTFADDFNPEAYDGNDGSLNFAGPWIEIGDNGTPLSGAIRTRPSLARCAPAPCVMVRSVNGDEVIERTMDLSGVAQATLSFDYSIYTNTQGVNVILDDGASAVVVEQLVAAAPGESGSRSIDIGSYVDLTSTVTIRFAAADASGTRTYIDTVLVEAVASVNQAPTVDVGPNLSINLPATATLVGSVADDGLPANPGATTAQWSQVSGPGTATFANQNATATTASFSAVGTYLLRLTADDGALTAFDELQVVVSAATLNGTFADDFNPQGYEGNDGTLSFAGPWTEINDNGNFVDGDVRMWTTNTACSPGPCVRIHAVTGNEGIERTVNLEGAAQATLAFDYFVYGGTNGVTLVLDDGTNAAVVQQLQVSASGGSGSVLVNIGDYIDLTSTVTVRYIATGATGNRSYPDNIVITASDTVANQAPVVSAGADLEITLPDAANLVGSVSDDGLPALPGAVTSAWSVVSGPGTVTFADAGAAATSATFSDAGSYTLRLTGDDGAETTSDDVDVTVTPPALNGSFADDFNPGGYTGNDGTLNFTGPWAELNDDGNSSTGDVWIWTTDAACTPAPCVRLHAVNGNEGIQRTMDLAGATQAILSFDYFVWGGTNGANLVLSDGTNTVTVTQLQVAASGGTASATIDIGTYVDLTSTVTVRFQATSATGNRTYPDNVVITAS